MTRTNLVIYPTEFKHESRILKETQSVAEQGLMDRIIITALWREGLKEYEELDGKRLVWRVKLRCARLPKFFLTEILKYLELMFKLLLHFRNSKVSVVSCHSLSVLPIGALFKLFQRPRLVYTPHELETERTGLSGVRKKLSKLVERALMPFVDKIIVPSQGCADWYSKNYGRSDVHVFLNTPFLKELESLRSSILRENLNIPNNAQVFLYHGLLGRGRAIRILLDTFAQLSGSKHLVIMGFGELEDIVKSYARRFSNIHFHPAVPPEDTVRYASGADVGICLIEDVSLSYYHSSPNKLFEYIHSGIPVIVSDFPDMGRIIEQHGCGWKIPVNEKSLLALLNTLTPQEIERKRAAAVKCRGNFCWSNYKEEVADIYDMSA
ncbi:MAG: glycosyltransferase [Deltaproteobacteria bacterium]|nr:glycosyltransferase [Deltaproteobacteria bacterium]